MGGHSGDSASPEFLTPVPALRPRLLARTALVDRLLSTPDASCAVVSAAPGYGRTTLLAMAARRSGGAVAWTSAGPWPDDADAFRGHLVTVIDPSGTDGSRSTLQEAMAARTPPGGGLLVVDDLDSLAQQALTGAVADIADSIPAGWRLLVGLCRAVPSSLARLGRRGQLVIVDEDDLVLGRQEAADLIDLFEVDMPAAARSRLVELAEGWPAAIVEALRGPTGSDPVDPGGWLLAVGIDRLLDPVFDEMAEADVDFLVRCSVLPALDADACAAVTGDDDAAKRLRRLYARRCYLRRPRIGGPLVMHGLLAEYLRRRLAERGGRVASEVRLRAAGVALEAGDTTAAIDHLMDAANYGAALDLIEAELASAMDSQRVRTVHAWYRRLPPGTHGRYIHLLGEAWSALLVGDLTTAEGAMAGLEIAVADAVQGEDEALASGSAATYGDPGWLAAQVHVLRAYRAAWLGRLGQMRREAEAARRLFGDTWGPQAAVVATLAVVRERLWVEDAAGARPLLTDALSRAGTSEYHRIVAFPSAQALLAAMEGRPRRAAYIADHVLDYLDSRPETYSIGPLEALLARSRARVDSGDARRALPDAVAVADRADSINHVPYAALGRIAAARALAAAGQLHAARQRLSEAAALLRSAAPGSRLLGSVHEVDAAVSLAQGDVAAAERVIRRLAPGNRQLLLRVRLLQARRPGVGLPELATLQPESPRQAAEAAVLLAAAGFVNGRVADAERYLAMAGDVAEDTGLVTPLVGASEELVGFADRMALRGRYRGLAELVAVSRTWHASRLTPAGPPALSAGELQLLALLRGRPRTDAMADHLGVSVNTVKTRLQRLYRKLDVTSRGEALRRAQDLHLMPPGP